MPTKWTVATEKDEEYYRRLGAIDGRFQVVHPDTGFVLCTMTLGEAFHEADDNATRKVRGTDEPAWSDPWAFEVYDRMARKGQAMIWRRRPKDSTHCFEKGDKYSMDAFWKCITKNGLPQPDTTDLTIRLWS